MKSLAAFAAAMLAGAPAWAVNNVALTSEVFVERVEVKDGQRTVRLEAPKMVVPADKLVFVNTYRNAGTEAATDFQVTNPLPAAVAYDGPGEGGGEVSVDGGKTYGALDKLKVRQPDGTDRAATPADVTHVRWTFTQPIPAGATGKLSFRGTVK